MKKIKVLSIGVLCALLMCGVVVGCSDNTEPTETPPGQVVLADFEKWAPDFQTLRLRNEFGSVDVNKDAERVKSGTGSAALTVVGASGSEKPYFFVNTVSALFGYDYSDFSRIDSISVWFYNVSETEENLYIGLITNIVSVEKVELQKYETFTLKPGWNEIVYKPDMNYVISAAGVDKYTGVQGIYFMFDNPHAASKADGKKFFIDDIVLHYGEEKPFTEVRAGAYYSHGSQIGPAEGLALDTPIPMENLQDKALAFDFRFESEEGRFGFAILCLDAEWSNVTGTLIIEKKADGTVESNMGRITAQEDGWYTWTLNSEFFSGDGVAKAKDVSLIYHQGETVSGDVIIDWRSMRATDAYEVSREERASHYTTDMVINGNYTGAPTLFEPIAIAEFAGKAVHFEFKFVTETGKFGFAIMDNPGWANITGTLTIEKKADGTIESNMGRVMELEDGWCAWELFSDFFAGDGAENAENVGLIYNQGETVQGEVLIDWRSLRAVEAQTYFSSNSKVAFEFSSGNGIVSQIPSENGTHNALKITNDNTDSQAQWMYFVLQLDPDMLASLDNTAKELALKVKLQRNTAASNVIFNFRIAPGKLDNSGKWVPDDAHYAKTKDDMDGTNADGYSNNVVLDTWHNIRFLRDAFWEKGDTIAALKANGGKIVIFVELENNDAGTAFEANTDFGYNLIIDDITISHYAHVLDFENAEDVEGGMLTTRSYVSQRVSTYEQSNEQVRSGEKAIKVYQNQHGALIVRIPDAMKDQLTANSKLTIRFMLAGVKTESGTEVPDAKATFAFYACGVPNPETDKNSDTWRDCRVAGNDWVANCEQGKWSTHEFSSELVQKIATNGYLWIECEMQNWQTYDFYVDYITLE